MAELYANNYRTYIQNALAADADDTTLVVSVAPPLALQAVGNWRLKIENEIFLVTNVDPDGVTLTVERGIEGTTIEEHAEGKLAIHPLTAGSLLNIVAEGTEIFDSNHLDDTLDAHDASAISVLDTGGNFTGNNVEDVLIELANSVSGQTVSLYGIAENGGPFPGYIQLDTQFDFDPTDSFIVTAPWGAELAVGSGTHVFHIEAVCQGLFTTPGALITVQVIDSHFSPGLGLFGYPLNNVYADAITGEISFSFSCLAVFEGPASSAWPMFISVPTGTITRSASGFVAVGVTKVGEYV